MAEFPLIGFGTMEPTDKDPPESPEAMYAATAKALEAGYRHIDTAEDYASLPFVGKALSDSKVPRDQLFVTSKIRGLPTDLGDLVARTKKVLADLQLASVDLLLIHFPGPKDLDLTAAPESLAERCAFAWFREAIPLAWQNMLQVRAQGLARHVGVSNFYAQHIRELERHCAGRPEDRPFADQIYVDAAHPETELVAELQGLGIRTIAYRPLAFLPHYAMIGVDEGLAAAAQGANATVQQLVLASLMQRGIHVIAKSTNPDHIAANLAALGKVGAVAADALQVAVDSEETANAVGACDEYALAFKAITAD